MDKFAQALLDKEKKKIQRADMSGMVETPSLSSMTKGTLESSKTPPEGVKKKGQYRPAADISDEAYQYFKDRQHISPERKKQFTDFLKKNPSYK